MGRRWAFLLWLSVCICSVGAVPACAEESAGVLFEKLLRVPQRVQLLQTSSHNKTGNNWDEYWPQYVDANGEEVLFDVRGPGCVRSMWGTNFDPNAVIKFYFDGATTPRYQSKIVDFYKGVLPEFPTPLVSYERRGKYGDNPFAGNAFAPIPFEESLKITVQGTAHFYHILYETYAASGSDASVADRQERSALLAAFSGNVQTPTDGLERIEFAMEDGLHAGRDVVIYSAKDTAGVIREITLEGDGSEDFFQRNHIRMKWDSAPRFQVLAPIGMFFGTAVRANDMRSLPLEVEKLADGRVRLRCRFPMAFWKDAEITIANRCQRTMAPVKATLLVGPNPIPREEGTYFTTMYQEGQTIYGHDWLLFEGSGCGWYAGTVQSMQGQHYCEGDEHFYLDGAISPQINGTGSEDYYLCCFWPNQDFDMPFGCVAGDIAIEGGGYYFGSYNEPSSYSRYHLEAPIPFYAGITAKIQHGGLSHILSRYRSLAFVYFSHRARLTRTDFLDVGKPQSEKAHGYACMGPSTVRRLQSHPEGDSFETSWGEDGRYHEGGTVSFTVAVDAENRGVRMRRRLDQEVPCQGAKVFVDGTYAGTWYWGYRNEHLRWYDQDFDIAPGLTAGKSALDIRLELQPRTRIRIPESSSKLLQPSVTFTDFSYTIFCFE
ncbi:MAG: DUF2961 domain-containing protein [Sedimentisphaerales bacterium]|nr:DUF2961 domain-containing protein [Sedimentisphaerales bacterium]